MQQNKTILVTGNAGQGKTTIARNISIALKTFGYDVLLVDADLKTPKLGFHFGMPLAERTIQDALLGTRELENTIYLDATGTKLIFSSLNTIKTPHASTLLPKLREMAEVIIIDTPNDEEWHKTKTETVIVTQPDFPSVLEALKLAKQVNLKGLIVNRRHSDQTEMSIENIKQMTNKEIIGSIPEEPKIREALKYGYSLLEFHPETKASNAIKQTAARLMNVEYNSAHRKTIIEKWIA